MERIAKGADHEVEVSVPEDEGSLMDLTVRELLEAVAAHTSAPGGGAAAAIATGLAAALAGMAARFSDSTEGAAPGAIGPDAAARADALRARALPLADADAAAYGAFLTALRRPREDPGRRAAVAEARDGATAVPAEIAEIAGEVSELASSLVQHGNPNLRGDAVASAQLAAASAATAAELVAANVGASRGHPMLARARVVALATRDRAKELTS